MREWIEECRRAWGPAPRAHSWRDRRYLRIRPGFFQWLIRDPLLRIYRNQEILRDRGRVVWGHLVVANQALFDPRAGGNYPAYVVYALAPRYDDRLDLLAGVAEKLPELGDTRPADSDLLRFADAMTDHQTRVPRWQIPPSFCGGEEIYLTVIMVHRKHLASPALTRSFFPLLVAPEETEAVMILPSRYWAPALIERWREEAPSVT